MDPLSIITTLWRHKWVTLPVVLLTIAACAYTYFFAPRTYEAHVSYALAAPKVPSSMELEKDPELAKLNSDNPYLRSYDSSLLAQVVITKLSDPAYVAQLKEAGFGTDFKITPVSSLGMGLVTVSAASTSESGAVATARLIGEQFASTLNSVQKVNGADDRYLYTPIQVLGPGPAQELFSNRLRSLIMVGIAGSILLFGSVSLARGRTIRRQGGGTAKALTTRTGRRAYNPVSQQGSTGQFPSSMSVPAAGPQLAHNDENQRLVAAGDRAPGR
ncbi:Lipopolysaccharide biosynthesis protein [Arthrobacter sp. 9AX]|uniref:chain-length determining protein n=1 Tax=Arthrobacter sp. 9AX TaxID=2653131 RepID=UPI0012F0EAAB|nr:chain-length determining protein [Arthrobacter sp. 9AX]VXB00033.1 Lipopolysaccharide biosynthesis protein [Arthrobacter sp. 9AX]